MNKKQIAQAKKDLNEDEVRRTEMLKELRVLMKNHEFLRNLRQGECSELELISIVFYLEFFFVCLS